MKILDSEVDLDASKYALFNQHRMLFALLLATLLMDALSTIYFMQRIGPQNESNFVVRQLSIAYGPVFGALFGKLYQLVGVWIITVMTPRLTQFVCAVIITLNCYAVVINMTM